MDKKYNANIAFKKYSLSNLAALLARANLLVTFKIMVFNNWIRPLTISFSNVNKRLYPAITSAKSFSVFFEILQYKFKVSNIQHIINSSETT
jgi:hypothetical protein